MLIDAYLKGVPAQWCFSYRVSYEDRQLAKDRGAKWHPKVKKWDCTGFPLVDGDIYTPLAAAVVAGLEPKPEFLAFYCHEEEAGLIAFPVREIKALGDKPAGRWVQVSEWTSKDVPQGETVQARVSPCTKLADEIGQQELPPADFLRASGVDSFRVLPDSELSSWHGAYCVGEFGGIEWEA